MSVSPRGDSFAVTSRDKQIRIFDFLSGKLRRTYNESSAVYSANSAMASSTVGHLSEHDLGRRLATERELEADTDSLSQCNCVFDDSGNLLVSKLCILAGLDSLTIGSLTMGTRSNCMGLAWCDYDADIQFVVGSEGAQCGDQQSGCHCGVW